MATLKFGKGNSDNQSMKRVASNFDDFATEAGIVGITEELEPKYVKNPDGTPTKEISSFYFIAETEDGEEGVLLVSKKLVEQQKGNLSLDAYDQYPVYEINKDRNGNDLKNPFYMIARGTSKKTKKSLKDRAAAKAAKATADTAKA